MSASKGVTQALPSAVDLEESLDLEQAADADVLGVLVAGTEQPAIHRLPRLRTRFEHAGVIGFGMRDQAGREPQFERMDAGDIAAVGEVELVHRIAVEKLPEAFVRRIVALQAASHEAGKAIEGGLGMDAAVYRGETSREWTHALQQDGLDLVRRLAPVLGVEAVGEQAAFAIGEPLEILPATRVVGILEHQRARARRLEHVVAHHVAHDADEHQVGGIAQRVLTVGALPSSRWSKLPKRCCPPPV